MKAFFLIVLLCQMAKGNYPVFDYRTRMRVLLLPADLRPGSVIYRLRGTDAEFDYPLTFGVTDEIGKSIIRIENMPCNPTHSYCQANVFLAKKLEPDRVYDLILSLKDSTGRETKVDSTIKATRGTSHLEDIFPYVPNVITVPESTKVGTVLEYVLARKNPNTSHHTYLELWGSEKFRIVQNLSTNGVANGSIVLTGALDYEDKSMYTLYVFCLDPYTIAAEDTRNLAGFQLPVIVQDDQDKPPVFNSIPPVTILGHHLKVGDKILQIQAQDGDRGSPRQIRYKLNSDGNQISSFFNISEKSGEVFLTKPLEQLAKMSKDQQPILLMVTAEEMRKNQWEAEPLSATTKVALLLENKHSKSPPYFQNNEYSARIPENSPQGTTIVFGEPYSTIVRDDDSGKEGVFSLSLENNNGTFEISPTVGEQKANFVIRVRNNKLLDFEERTYVLFSVVAKELTTPDDSDTPMKSTANVTVYIDDQNDNPPMFLQDKYEAEIPENVTAGTVITQVQATDVDTGIYGKIFYTNILGNVNQSLAIDSVTGVITVATNNHGFDRESAQEYRLMVEARDMEGTGNMATVLLIIKLLDVNDETPQFERPTFEFILQPNLRNFTSRAFVKATDADAEKPNNVVRYEIISGNYENKFGLNEITGELFIRGKLKDTNLRHSDLQNSFYDSNSDFGEEISSVIVLTVRAYDLGVPHRWTHTYVRIYPPESRARNMNFIVSGSNKDKKAIEELLRQLTGGRISIQDIQPYTGRESGTDLSYKYGSNNEKSVVSATVFYDGNSFVDLNQVEKKLTRNKTQAIVEETVSEYMNRNRVLFWLMMFFLILLLLILLLLILCCIWQGCCICPIFDYDGKRIVSPMENIRFIAHEQNKMKEAKDVQGKTIEPPLFVRNVLIDPIRLSHPAAVTQYDRREAWSGRNGTRTIIHYDQNPTKEKLVRQIKIDGTNNFETDGVNFRSHDIENGGPNIIYTREFIRSEHDRTPTMVIEDVEINPYTMKTTTIKSSLDDFRKPTLQLNTNSERGLDSDSIRHHEIEKGSDTSKIVPIKVEKSPEEKVHRNSNQNIQVKEYRVVLEPAEDNATDLEIDDTEREGSGREHYYIREGNAEILRLVTRGDPEDEKKSQGEVNENVDKGIEDKDIIMKKFIEGQKQSTSSGEEFTNQLRFHKEFQDRHTITSYNRSIVSETTRNLQHFTHEFDPRFLGYTFQNQETQSLPGVMEMSTQTERDCGTQTEELVNLRPPRRKVRSDNEFSEDDDDIRFDDSFHRHKFWEEGMADGTDPVKRWIPKESKNFRGKKIKRHKMKTPILEEGELEGGIRYDTRPAMFKMPDSEGLINGSGTGAYTENKTSILRRRKIKEKILEEEEKAAAENAKNPAYHEDYSSGEESVHRKTTSKTRKSRRDFEEIKKETTTEIKDLRSDSLSRLYEVMEEFGENELERIKKETRERTASLNRFYNALAEFEAEAEEDLGKSNIAFEAEQKDQKQPNDRVIEEKVQSSELGRKIKSEDRENTATSRIPNQEISASRTDLKDVEGGIESDNAKRSQRSKYMDWYNDLSSKKGKSKKSKREKKKEDDLDSGIAMPGLQGSKTTGNNPKEVQQKVKTDQLLEKKSVFTIAYDDVRTKSIRPETNSSEKH